jgi:dynein assembly factor 2
LQKDMSFNPYASEDFNRIQTKAAKSFDEQKAEREAAAKQVDHPLVPGQKLDMTAQELKSFTHAMGREEFRAGLDDYIDEISDPKHKPEMQQYLRQLEEQGDLPPGTVLIQPEKGFCIKSSCKRLTSEVTKSYFDQKCFINVCYHEKVDKPQKEQLTNADGKTGWNWKLPYRVSKLRYDQDTKKQVCATYDVVFHTDVRQFVDHPEFKKFVADTALDGIGQVLAEQKEKVSRDYKVLKNLDCKGGEPSLMTVRELTGNPLVDNMELDHVETRLQKEIEKTRQAQMSKEEREAEMKKKEAEAAKNFDNGEVEEEEEEAEEAPEERPVTVIQPKYKIVHSYPMDVGDAWGGYTTSQMDHEREKKRMIPTHVTVTIDLKWAESMKGSLLDINESTLVFEYPSIYYLDLNLKYKVDPDAGNAKFDKTKKTLTIKLPIIGLTADS